MQLFDGYIFDLDGTVYLGDELIPGARETILRLRELGKKVVFLSNKPLETRADYAAKLTRLGIPTQEEEVVNSTYVLAQYLKKRDPKALTYVIGEQALLTDLERAGIAYTLSPDEVNYEIDYVIIAFDRTFHYDKLNHALQAVKKGAKLIATNADRTCPVPGGEVPDAAGMIGAIEGVTGKKVEVVVGKPSPITVDIALSALQVAGQDCIMVGDRLETDMVMAQNAGIPSALVMTGVTDEAMLASSEIRPDFVLSSIADLLAE
ncbi:MAG: HAD-IIA family hydrolase [Firmicutes bacterium]|nr:HAD-IIA family hydrolase [Bacillota bacterium]